MTDRIIIYNYGQGALLTESRIKRIDSKGYFALDAFSAETFDSCLKGGECDPWEYLRHLGENLNNTRLSVTLGGQCLIGTRCFADDTVSLFVEKLIENGVGIIRAYDALNDPRNLSVVIDTAKKLGAFVQAAMIYSENNLYSPAFFAGYASQLASMGADSISIFDPEARLTQSKARELIRAVKGSVEVPLAISSKSSRVTDTAFEEGVDMADLFYETEQDDEDILPGLKDEIERVRAEAGCPPLAYPISQIIKEQATLNCSSEKRYSSITDEFRALVKGCYGRSPLPTDQVFVSSICGADALVLVRPADMLAPELDSVRERVAQWYEQEEDILTLAVYGELAESFFEVRKARKYALDIPRADARLGIHTV